MDDADRRTAPGAPEVLAGGADPRLPLRWAAERDDWRDRWRVLPLAQRRHVRRGALVLAVVLAGAGAGAGLAHWRDELALGDEVRLRARLGVTVAATTSAGRVDYHLSLRNDGPRRVRVRTVRLDGPRLQGHARALLPADVDARATVDVPLSVRLDCRAPAEPASHGVRVVVTAVPGSGRQRQLELAADDGRVLTAPAGTLCRVRPGLVVEELSGPVLARRDGS